jgi:hypothetical protein
MELVEEPPTPMRVVVLAATTRRAIFQIPDWSTEVAICLDAQDPQWPHVCTVERPAVNIEYTALVDLAGDVPRFAKWYPRGVEHDKPSPLAAPNGLPGTELLPIHESVALDRTLDAHLGALDKTQRESVAYLIRRAHGQGYMEGRRNA